MKFNIGTIFKYKSKWLQVIKGNDCKLCFFYYKNFPYKKIEDKGLCNETDLYECADDNANYNVIYKEVSEIEALILKGEQHEKRI